MKKLTIELENMFMFMCAFAVFTKLFTYDAYVEKIKLLQLIQLFQFGVIGVALFGHIH